ncbi:MAG TPA: ATP-binding protein, partial [Acidobacteriota bacterium]
LGLDLYFSERCAEILGYTVAEVPGPAALSAWVLERIHPDDRVAHGPSYLAFVAGHSSRFAADLRLRDKSGEWVDVAVSMKAVGLEPDGRVAHVAGSMIDLTERKLLEAQFRQAQKMEAVGRLAGGVAHDFNNLLTAIFAFGKFVRDTLPPDSRAHKDMDELLRVAKRAENLTGQLLAFSRRQTIAPRVLNLNAIVQDIDRMVRRLLGDDIDFSTNLAPDLWNTRVDRGAFEQVMVNLAVNARDAMPAGGKLTIETQNVELQESYSKQHGAEVAPGSYVLMALSDSGVGMDAETQQHIFEPFYTSKEPGKGTGLGLSTCYGIVKQAGGYIWVYSELGEGTTFKVYLPRVLEEEESPWEAPPPESLLGTERILIAEDNEHVRIIASRSLAELGYVVVQTANPDEAIAAAESAAQPFDLLLTDVVMPGMSGKQLAERLQAAQPGLRVIYMTGYTANAIVHRGVLEPGTHLVQKPFTPESLAQKVRQALDTDSTPPPPDGAEGEQE